MFEIAQMIIDIIGIFVSVLSLVINHKKEHQKSNRSSQKTGC